MTNDKMRYYLLCNNVAATFKHEVFPSNYATFRNDIIIFSNTNRMMDFKKKSRALGTLKLKIHISNL